jgi:hypothetical protein
VAGIELSIKQFLKIKFMSTGTRIPHALGKFDQYIRTVVPFLQAGGPPDNGTRLGMSAAEIAQAQAFLLQWHTGNPAAPGAYELHSNKGTKNKTTRAMVIKIIKDFATFFNPILIRMSGSAAITASDRITLNIAPPVAVRQHLKTQISDIIFIGIKQLGGGDMRFSCRSAHDAKRASKPKHADCLQLALKVGDPVLTSPDDATAKLMTFTKATFTLKLGATYAGMKLSLYGRWYNSKYPNLSGPWSAIMVIVIAS